MVDFGDTLTYALIVTLFGMGIVFLVLVLLQYILAAMKLVFYKEGKVTKAAQEPVAKAAEVPASDGTVSEEAEEGEEQLIAVISAAVMSCMGRSSNIVVRKIRRVDDRTPAWGKAGRTEQIASRF